MLDAVGRECKLQLLVNDVKTRQYRFYSTIVSALRKYKRITVIAVFLISSSAPSDYDAATTAFTFDPSNNRQCETVIVNNDDILEGTEDFFGSLTTNDAGVTLTPDNVRVDIFEDGERCTKATN